MVCQKINLSEEQMQVESHHTINNADACYVSENYATENSTEIGNLRCKNAMENTNPAPLKLETSANFVYPEHTKCAEVYSEKDRSNKCKGCNL